MKRLYELEVGDIVYVLTPRAVRVVVERVELHMDFNDGSIQGIHGHTEAGAAVKYRVRVQPTEPGEIIYADVV